MEQIVLGAITQHIQDNQRIRPSQHGFMKGRSCLTNMIPFYDQVTCLVHEENVVDVIYLDFFYGTILDKLAAHGLIRDTLSWVKICLDGYPLWW